MLRQPEATEVGTVETVLKGGEKGRTTNGGRQNGGDLRGNNHGGKRQERVEPTPVLEGIGRFFCEESLAGVQDEIGEVWRHVRFLR